MKAKGLCGAHYERKLKFGEVGGPIWDKPDTRAFLEYAASFEGEGCLLWPFGCSSNGYGAVGHKEEKGGVHRIVCRMTHGDPFEGALAAHSCGNRQCVNPKHLRWATSKENNADMDLHGTRPVGEMSGSSKLTSFEVREIIRLRETGLSFQKIGDQFGIAGSCVRDIIIGKSWASVTKR